MLGKQVDNKQDLIKLLQTSKVKKVKVQDIKDKADINDLVRDAEQLLRSNHDVTLIVIGS
jgi:ABC-type metal ion transport system substrate-binding protein